MKGTAKRVAVFALLLALPACDDGRRYEFHFRADDVPLYKCDTRTGEVWRTRTRKEWSGGKLPDEAPCEWQPYCR